MVSSSLWVVAEVQGDAVRAVTLRQRDSGDEVTVAAAFVIDATELGDLLPLAGCEYAKGFESRTDTGEPSASSSGAGYSDQGQPVTAAPATQPAVSVRA